MKNQRIASLEANLLKVLDYIYSGKMFTVEFRKSNGQWRLMKARTGVKKYLTGKGLGYDPKDFNLITVFDMEKRAYRSFKLHQVDSIKFKNTLYC